MKTILASLLLLAGLLVGCGKKEAAPDKAATNTAGSNPLTAPADYVGAIGQAKKYSEKAIDLAQVKKAIQLFEAQEDRFPKDLNELVAKQYLQILPVLPTGMKYQYNAANGEIKAIRTP